MKIIKSFPLASSLLIALAFALPSSAQSVGDIFDFSGAAYPQAITLVQARDGQMYGTTWQDGTEGFGTIFRVNTNGSCVVIHTFDGTNGSLSFGGLMLATDGNLYGTAESGGKFGHGVLFKINAGGHFAVLYNFTGGFDGDYPGGPPIEASDGNLYGATLSGGIYSKGTIYKYSRSAILTTIHSFDGSEGTNPNPHLIQAADGNLYGTAVSGGTYGFGTVFKMDRSGNVLHAYSFNGGKYGSYPYAPLIQANDSNFYGTTSSGSARSIGGAVYKVDRYGFISLVHGFQKDGNGYPEAGLVQGSDGNLYGVTGGNGYGTYGVIYQVDADGNYSELYEWPTYSYPNAAMLQHTTGMFYGVSHQGGINGAGNVYSLDMGLGPFVAFVRPTGKVGETAQILGQGLTGSTSVTFNGVPATRFSVVRDTYMTAVVPSGAGTGPVVVTTPSGKLTSNVNFRFSR